MENEELFNKLANNEPLDAAAQEKLLSWQPRKSYQKNHLILAPGDIPDCFWYIEQGAASGYFYEDGRKINIFIRIGGQLMIPANEFMTSEASTIYIRAVEDTILRCVSYEELSALLDKYPGNDQTIKDLIADHHQVLQVEKIELQDAVAYQYFSNPLNKQNLEKATISLAEYLDLSVEDLNDFRGMDQA